MITSVESIQILVSTIKPSAPLTCFLFIYDLPNILAHEGATEDCFPCSHCPTLKSKWQFILVN